MQREGKLTIKAPDGERGVKGGIGDPGADKLPHGSDGPAGEMGQNAGRDLTLSSEQVPFELKRDVTKAISKIDIEEISADENFITVTRSNLGNPDACPTEIVPDNKQSFWVLAMADDARSSEKLISPPGEGHCGPCKTEIFYFDIEPILDAIRAKFQSEVERVKRGFEGVVTFWLRTMADLFNEQKAALCCALENCRSRYRNNDTRRYLEQSRLRAMTSDLKTILNADPLSCDRTVEQTNDPEKCEVPFSPRDNPTLCNPSPEFEASGFFQAGQIGLGQSGISSSAYSGVLPLEIPSITMASFKIKSEADYEISYASNNYNGSLVISKNDFGSIADFKSSIEPGFYYIYMTNISNKQGPLRISSLDNNVKFHTGSGPGWKDSFLQGTVLNSDAGISPGESWWLRVEILKESQSTQEECLVVDARKNIGNIKNAADINLPPGIYMTEIIETNTEIGGKFTGHVAIRFKDDEGDSFTQFINYGPQDNLIDSRAIYENLTLEFAHTGGVVSAYIPISAFVPGDGRTVLRFTEKARYYDGSASNLQPTVQIDIDQTCQVHYSHLKWYEQGWQAGNCNGCQIHVAGQDFIIVQRIEGENDETSCIAKFKGLGHPAIAWPTFDGENFAGMPTTGMVTLKFEQSLNDRALKMLKAGQILSTAGSYDKIPIILFPVS